MGGAVKARFFSREIRKEERAAHSADDDGSGIGPTPAHDRSTDAVQPGEGVAMFGAAIGLAVFALIVWTLFVWAVNFPRGP